MVQAVAMVGKGDAHVRRMHEVAYRIRQRAEFAVTLAAVGAADISSIIDSCKDVMRVFAEQNARDSWLIHSYLFHIPALNRGSPFPTPLLYIIAYFSRINKAIIAVVCPFIAVLMFTFCIGAGGFYYNPIAFFQCAVFGVFACISICFGEL